MEEGSTLVIDCTPIGQTAVVMFGRNGDSPPASAVIDNFTLTVENVGIDDDGQYSCSAFGLTEEVEVVVIPGRSIELFIAPRIVCTIDP